MDFDRGGSLAELLVEFMSEMNLSACDLSFRQYVNYTYERGDGASQSWIDHILCTESFSSCLSDVYTLRNLSDHLPLHFSLHVNCLTNHCPSSSHPSLSSPTPFSIDWHCFPAQY